ncbi:unnamed protein product [Pieris brassicae]|uniref:Uncharacterized protein n=1 Tax=Pieris brassicae TaxID=7116 RepID=A0A9P0TJQ6_PIEBR|nr:unnamed protein product [Pieris brassicae]
MQYTKEVPKDVLIKGRRNRSENVYGGNVWRGRVRRGISRKWVKVALGRRPSSERLSYRRAGMTTMHCNSTTARVQYEIGGNQRPGPLHSPNPIYILGERNKINTVTFPRVH